SSLSFAFLLRLLLLEQTGSRAATRTQILDALGQEFIQLLNGAALAQHVPVGTRAEGRRLPVDAEKLCWPPSTMRAWKTLPGAGAVFGAARTTIWPDSGTSSLEDPRSPSPTSLP